MIQHNIPDYCYTEEGSIYLLTSITALIVTGYKSDPDKRAYWIMFRGSKESNPHHMVSESEYKQLYNAIKERDRLVRESINNNIEGSND